MEGGELGRLALEAAPACPRRSEARGAASVCLPACTRGTGERGKSVRCCSWCRGVRGRLREGGCSWCWGLRGRPWIVSCGWVCEGGGHQGVLRAAPEAADWEGRGVGWEPGQQLCCEGAGAQGGALGWFKPLPASRTGELPQSREAGDWLWLQQCCWAALGGKEVAPEGVGAARLRMEGVALGAGRLDLSCRPLRPIPRLPEGAAPLAHCCWKADWQPGPTPIPVHCGCARGAEQLLRSKPAWNFPPGCRSPPPSLWVDLWSWARGGVQLPTRCVPSPPSSPACPSRSPDPNPGRDTESKRGTRGRWLRATLPPPTPTHAAPSTLYTEVCAGCSPDTPREWEWGRWRAEQGVLSKWEGAWRGGAGARCGVPLKNASKPAAGGRQGSAEVRQKDRDKEMP